MDAIPFNNLKPLYAAHKDEVDAAVQRVLDRGYYILGPEGKTFEAAFAAYHGVKHAIGVANGTDAIELALRGAGIGPGDEVITVAHTAIATVYAVERAGATPVMVDIDPATYTLDPSAFAAAITPRTRAVIPVHLYGQPAAITSIKAIAEKHNLLLIEDCAQAHGARFADQLVGTLGAAGTFSFYPTKNVGAYGDGGAIITDDDAYAERLRRLRNYGQTSRYHSAEYGINSRLDELQAAILQINLAHLDAHNQRRREIAAIYNSALPAAIKPVVRPDVKHVYHLYVIRHPQRDALMEMLKAKGVGTLIHYPVPVHLQAHHRQLGHSEGDLPHTEKAAQEILSLPMYIGLSDDDAQRVAEAVNASLEEIGA